MYDAHEIDGVEEVPPGIFTAELNLVPSFGFSGAGDFGLTEHLVFRTVIGPTGGEIEMTVAEETAKQNGQTVSQAQSVTGLTSDPPNRSW